MVRTRGGGSSRGRKFRSREDDVPEQWQREEDPGGAKNLVRRSPRLLKTTVRGGATSKVSGRISGAASKRRLEIDCTPKRPEQKKLKKKPSEDEVRDVDEAEVRDGNGGEGLIEKPAIEEQSCMELALVFGDEAREDNCEMDEDSGDDVCDEDNIPEPASSDEENEENGWLGEPYREDVDPEEFLKLGKTFCDADDFKHACVRYTLKTKYNIKFSRSGAYKIGAICAATPKPNHLPCPWKVYCAFEKSKMKMQIKTYIDIHTCEKTGILRC